MRTWSSLIDSQQYGGSLLYGSSGNGFSISENPYQWEDKGKTLLQHIICERDGRRSYEFGGHAISHYNSKFPDPNGSINSQLTVFNGDAADVIYQTTGGGHNGSKNFAMHYGYLAESEPQSDESLPTIRFTDDNARVIDHMYVNNSTYALTSYENINNDDWVKIVATGEDTDHNTKTAEFYLYNGRDNIIKEWTKFDLSSLGAVIKIRFNIVSSVSDLSGLAYFAYDDLAVRFPLVNE